MSSITRPSRRQFLASLAGLGAMGFLGARYFGKRWDSEDQGSFFDSAIYPLFYSGSHGDLGSELSLQGMFSAKTRHHVVVFDPEGNELFRDVREFGAPAVEKLSLPPGLGWVSVFTVMESDARLGLSPNIEAGQFIRTTQPRGRDAHHGYLWRNWPRADQVLLSPDAGEAVLLGMTNPLGSRQEVTLRALGEDGKVVLEKTLRLNPCQTAHFLMGEWQEGTRSPLPPRTTEMPVPRGKALLFSATSEAGTAMPLASWWWGRESGFTMSHGGFWSGDETSSDPYRGEAKVDLAFADADSDWGVRSPSRLLVPNWHGHELEVRAQVSAGASGETQERVLRIPSRGIADLELSAKGWGALLPSGPLTMTLQAGNGVLPQALVKIINWDRRGRRSLQHGRPNDRMFGQALESYLSSRGADGRVEQWISDGPWLSAGHPRVTVYNLNDHGDVRGELHGLRGDGTRVVSDLGVIKAGAWTVSSLSADLRGCQALCLLAEGGLLRMSLHQLDEQGLASSVHSTPRIKWAGRWKNAPPLISSRERA